MHPAKFQFINYTQISIADARLNCSEITEKPNINAQQIAPRCKFCPERLADNFKISINFTSKEKWSNALAVAIQRYKLLNRNAPEISIQIFLICSY